MSIKIEGDSGKKYDTAYEWLITESHEDIRIGILIAEFKGLKKENQEPQPIYLSP